MQMLKNYPEYYLPIEVITSNLVVTASFKKGLEPKNTLPLPVFNKLENINIISIDNHLEIDIPNELIDDKIYKNIFGKRVYLLTYEDENSLENYIIDCNHFTINKNSENFKITIVETFEHNTKITGEIYTFEYNSNFLF